MTFKPQQKVLTQNKSRDKLPKKKKMDTDGFNHLLAVICPPLNLSHSEKALNSLTEHKGAYEWLST